MMQVLSIYSIIFFISLLSYVLSSSRTAVHQSLPYTVFASDGKLVKLEQIVRESSSTENQCAPTVIALHCSSSEEEREDEFEDFIIVVFTKSKSPYTLIYNDADDDEKEGTESNGDKKDEESNSETSDEKNTFSSGLFIKSQSRQNHSSYPIVPLCPMLVAAAAGGGAIGNIDSSILIRRIQEYAISLQRTNGFISSNALARRLADVSQTSTQSLGSKAGRILKSSALVLGKTADTSQTIWRIDPTGQFWNCHAAAIGRGAGVAEQHLLKKVALWGKAIVSSNEEENAGAVNNRNSNDKEEEIPFSQISSEHVEEYLSTLNCDSALELACNLILETQTGQKENQSEENKRANSGELSVGNNVYEQHGLQCIILGRRNDVYETEYLDSNEIYRRLLKK